MDRRLDDGPTQRNVPQAFVRFQDEVSLLAIGTAKSEPFFANVKVAGQMLRVIVQLFERRILTYIADNPPALQVERGNIGVHYYR